MSRSAENRLIQQSWRSGLHTHAPLDPAMLIPEEPPRGAVPLTTTGHSFNINSLLVQNILESSYMKSLVDATYPELIDAIQRHVKHVEPWSAGTSRTPSTAWCVLYRMLCMRLTRNQMKSMLNHAGSVYVRAVAFLYLRLATDPKELWDWYEPYLDDDQEITPGSAAATKTTVAQYLRGLLENLKYFKLTLPRIPVLTKRQIQVKLLLLDQAEERAAFNARFLHRFKRGAKVRAIFSEDDQWYDATLGEEVADGVFLVTYDNYHNSEERALGFIELPDNPAPIGGARGGDRAERKTGNSYEDLRKQVLARERNRALASGKDYAQRPASYKGSLSLRMDTYTSRHRGRSRSRSPVRRRGAGDRDVGRGGGRDDGGGSSSRRDSERRRGGSSSRDRRSRDRRDRDYDDRRRDRDDGRRRDRDRDDDRRRDRDRDDDRRRSSRDDDRRRSSRDDDRRRSSRDDDRRRSDRDYDRRRSDRDYDRRDRDYDRR